MRYVLMSTGGSYTTKDNIKARSAAIVGAGTIGLSWSVLLASQGWKVRIFDPREDLQAAITNSVHGAIPALQALGCRADHEQISERIVVSETLEHAVAGAALVQENGPERVDWKRDLFAKLEATASMDAVLATSSSSIPASVIAEHLDDGGRVIVGHPYNPPHVVPVVEVVPGPKTSKDTVGRATEIYRGLGRTPIVLNKEIRGFVGDRLQLAVLREASYLVHEGVVDPESLDELMRGSLGLRWAAIGPLAAMHLGGGSGGARYPTEHVGAAMSDLQLGVLSDEQMADVATAIDAAYGRRSYDEMAEQAGAAEIAILKALSA